MRLSRIGERGLIERFARAHGGASRRVLVGIGDDAAVIRPRGRRLLLLTCDMVIEGVHFDLRWASPWQVGHKAVAAAASDVAAMGGEPRQALVSVAVPPRMSVEKIESLAEGMRACASANGFAVVGGDTVRSPGPLVADVTVVGEVERRGVLLRSGARAGDLLMVTGTIGDAAAGLASFRRKLRGADPDSVYLVRQRLLLPRPRIHAGRVLARRRLPSAMIDLSDGLASEVSHLCSRSGVGARIWLNRLPISVACTVVAEAAKQDVSTWALHGGEDYELLFTIPRSRAAAAMRLLAEETGHAPTAVGEIVSRDSGIHVVTRSGRSAPLRRAGFQHF